MSVLTDILGKIAPTVATALLGPLAGAAVSGIGSLLGISEPTQEKITKMFSDGQITTDQLAAIRELDLKYQNDEKERQFKYSELVFKDVDSARNLAIQTKSMTPDILSYAVLIGGGILMASVMYGTVKADSVLAGTIIGYAVSEMKQVLTFWFGRSSDDNEKTKMLYNSTPPPPK